jgi:hypothetical protein
MRTVGREELFASLRGQGGVVGGQDNISDRNMAGTLVLLDIRGKVIVLHVSGAVPRSEEAHFTEVSIVGEIKLRTQAQDFAVQDDGAGIVSAVSVKDGKTVREN